MNKQLEGNEEGLFWDPTDTILMGNWDATVGDRISVPH